MSGQGLSGSACRSSDQLTRLLFQPCTIPYLRAYSKLISTIADVALILIVDDNVDTCTLLIRLLKKVGHQVECVESGQAAIEYLSESETPDLIILDYMMPDMDGVEVLKIVRADPKHNKTPIAFYTASDDVQLFRNARHLGADDIWAKLALDIDELNRRVALLLFHPRQQANE